ncbi:DNA-directed DNA polymerase alpha catalytic subunit pol1 [Phlyctochytrium planicorne]|nr:DNA-directed DNA polymerase alpha catalytic subunit pol1 [Phlyctochytrium planicorne]
MRRSGQRNKRAAFDLLKQSRETGQSFLDLKQTTEDSVFEEVDEEEFVRREDLQDFLEDDDGYAYLDDESDHYSSEEEENEPTRGKRKKDKAPDSSKAKKARPEARITSFLSKQARSITSARPAAASGEAIGNAKADTSFLNSILGDMDAEIADAETEEAGKTMAVELPVAKESQRAMPTLNFGLDFDRSNSPPPFEDGHDMDHHPVAIHLSTDEQEDMIENKENQDKSVAESLKPTEHEIKPKGEQPVQLKKVQLKKLDNDFSAFLPTFEAPATVPTDNKDPPGVGPSNSTGPEISSSDMKDLSNFEHIDGNLIGFWFDAFEKDDSVYMFVKLKVKDKDQFVTSCIQVKNVERNVYFLPRTKKMRDGKETDVYVEMEHVFEEVDKMRARFKIKEFGTKVVTRKYAFECPDVPPESEYLKVVYSFKEPSFPNDLSGENFSRVFGSNTSALETFIIKRKLMGPSWICIREPSLNNSPLSWTKMEMQVESPKSISPLDKEAPFADPPFSIMSLNLKTIMNHQKKTTEIVVATIQYYQNGMRLTWKIDILTLLVVPVDSSGPQQVSAQYSLLRQLPDIPLPLGFMEGRQKNIDVHKSERSLLNHLTALIHRLDPDILIGHNLIGVLLGVLLHRLKYNKVDSWSKLGRLRRSKWPKLNSNVGQEISVQERQICSGRILCDTFMSAKEYIQKAKSYDLTYLAATQFNVEREDLEPEKIPAMFWDAKQLHFLVNHCHQDAFLAAQLMFRLKIVPLTKQLTTLAGNLWSRTILAGSRADRNEYLLLHEFHKRKYVVPDKYSRFKSHYDYHRDEVDGEENNDEKQGSKKKAGYAGGLVLEPKKGFYDKYVLLLDFNSLYPTIIQEFNICFTTVERTGYVCLFALLGINMFCQEDMMPSPPDPSVPVGVLPRLLASLVDRRRSVKSLLKDPKLSEDKRNELDTRQLALKLTANSMYGCLGFVHSRFYAKPLAMLITHKGREILQATVNLAEEEKLEVVYGDTDSVMIHTQSDNFKEAQQMAFDFKKQVNKRYKLLEIDIDGFMSKLLLLKKKKYAALLVDSKDPSKTTLEKKGLDIVRRDWSKLSHDASSFVLDELFSDANREDIIEKIHQYLRNLGEQVRAGQIPTDHFIITKSLTKNPEDYADAKHQPHVQVALTMKKKGYSFRSGEVVPYVICIGATGPLSARAHHPDELKLKELDLKIDFEYYLVNQILPPILRLCSPIAETDQVKLANCLGIESSKFSTLALPNPAEYEGNLFTLESTETDIERFKDVEPLEILCRVCGHVRHYPEPSSSKKSDVTSSLLKCTDPACGSELEIGALKNQLLAFIRAKIRKFQQGWLICDERGCGTRTRSISVFGKRCIMPECTGVVSHEYSDKKLNMQLMYLDTLLDPEKVVKNSKIYGSDAEDLFTTLLPLRDLVRRFLDSMRSRSLSGGKHDRPALRRSRSLNDIRQGEAVDVSSLLEYNHSSDEVTALTVQDDVKLTLESRSSSPPAHVRRVVSTLKLDDGRRILEENRKRTLQLSSQTFSELASVLYPGPVRIRRDVRDYEFFQYNIDSHKVNRRKFLLHMANRLKQQREKRIVLEQTYREKYDAWKKKSDRLEQKAKKRKDSDSASSTLPQSVSKTLVNETAMASITGSTRTSRRGNPGMASFTSDSVKSEAEWQEVLAMIAATEGGAAQPKSTMQALACAKDPQMIIDPLERKIFNFHNNNHSVVDPVKRLDAENLSLSLKWSEKDRETFRLRIMQFGKNFPKISQYLGTKTTQDCIEFYYRFKHVYGFKQLIRRGGPGRGVKRKAAAVQASRKSTLLQKDTETVGKTRASLLGRNPAPGRPLMPIDGATAQVNSFAPDPDAVDDGDADDAGVRKRPRMDDNTSGITGKMRRRGLRDLREKDSSPSSPARDELAPGMTADSDSVRWSVDEKGRALEAFAKYGRDFENVAAHVKSKSVVECETFYDNYKRKLRLDELTDSVHSPKEKKKTKAGKKGERSKLGSDMAVFDRGREDIGEGDELNPALGELEDYAADGDELGNDDGEGDESRKAKRKKSKRKAGEFHNGDPSLREEERLAENRSPGPLRSGELGSPLHLPTKAKTVSYWSRAEKEEFVKAIQMFGRDWDQIAKSIGSKSAVQSRNHYHNYRLRLNYDEIIVGAGHQLKEEDMSLLHGAGDSRMDEDEDLSGRVDEFDATKPSSRRSLPSGASYEREDGRTADKGLSNQLGNSHFVNSQPSASPHLPRRLDDTMAGGPPNVGRQMYNPQSAPFHPAYPNREPYGMHYSNPQDYPGASYSMTPYMDVMRGPQPPPGMQFSTSWTAAKSKPPSSKITQYLVFPPATVSSHTFEPNTSHTDGYTASSAPTASCGQ